MSKRPPEKRLITKVPPWVLLGAVVVMLPLFALYTFESIHRQNRQSVQLLMEKGAALIRSIEAGARTGMSGGGGGVFELEQLLVETAHQPDIVYILVTDADGRVLFHSDPKMIGRLHGGRLLTDQLGEDGGIAVRALKGPTEQGIFEVFRQFNPTRDPGPLRRHRMMMHRWMFPQEMQENLPDRDLFIYIGLDTGSMKAARKGEILHIILMGLLLLVAGFGGVVLLFMAQSARSVRHKLSQVRAFSDNLVAHLPMGLIALDGQGTIAALNRAAGDLLALSPDESIGKDAGEVLPEALTDLVPVRPEGCAYPARRIEIRVGQARKVPVEVGVAALSDEKDRPVGTIFLIRDLTEVRSLQKEVARSQRLATVGRLAAGVAHEIRNPLSSIKGFATYFSERYRDAPEDQHIAGIMIQEVDRLNRVVGQLLDLARPVNVSRRRVVLEDVIGDSLTLIREDATDKGIALSGPGEKNIGECLIDPDILRQALLNLYLNAIEAMEPGGELAVHVEHENGRISVTVSDTGHGIDEKDLSNIFDPYFTTKPTGTGLGLAIVHNIIEAHGGEVRITSHKGQGTSATIFLPHETTGQKP